MIKTLHSRVITFKFLGPTNHRPSRVVLHDTWQDEKVTLSLSGADMMETIEEHLNSQDITIQSYGYTEPTACKGVILVDSFDKRIK